MRVKDDIIKELKDSFNSTHYKLITELLYHYRHEARKGNDAVTEDLWLRRNQGEIGLCERISKDLGLDLDILEQN